MVTKDAAAEARFTKLIDECHRIIRFPTVQISRVGGPIIRKRRPPLLNHKLSYHVKFKLNLLFLVNKISEFKPAVYRISIFISDVVFIVDSVIYGTQCYQP